MNWKKAALFGLLFWVLMFVIVSVMIVVKLYTPGEANVVVAVIAGVLAYLFAMKVKPKDQSEALKYGAVWVVVGLVLDALVTMRFSPTIFQMWTLWLGYAFLLLVPMLAVKKS